MVYNLKDIPELQNDVDSTNNSFERNKDQYSVALLSLAVCNLVLVAIY